jgi:hypothetical protein
MPQNPGEDEQREVSSTDDSSSSNSDVNKKQDDGGRIVPTNSDVVPVIPGMAISQDTTVVSIMANPSVLDALVQEAPTEVMRFVEAADERQFRYRT